MPSPGIWVSMNRNGRWEAALWLNIGRTWYVELRSELRIAWHKKYGATIPAVTPKVWVQSELAKRSITLTGGEAIHLPAALYMKVRLAEGGDRSEAQGTWKVLPGLLPEAPGKEKKVNFLSRFFGHGKDRS